MQLILPRRFRFPVFGRRAGSRRSLGCCFVQLALQVLLVVDPAQHCFYRGRQAIRAFVEFQSGFFEVSGRPFLETFLLVLLRETGQHDDRNVHGGGIVFQSFQHAGPLILGSSMSSRLMSGGLSWIDCSASSPSAAVPTSKPALHRARSLAIRRNLLSSIKSTLALEADTRNPRVGSSAMPGET